MLPLEAISRQSLVTRCVSRSPSSPKFLKSTRTWSTSSSRKTLTRESTWSKCSSTPGSTTSNRNSSLTGSLTRVMTKMEKVPRGMRAKNMTMRRRMKRRTRRSLMSHQMMKAIKVRPHIIPIMQRRWKAQRVVLATWWHMRLRGRSRWPTRANQ